MADKKAFLEIEKLNFDIQYIITMIYYQLRNLAVTPKNIPTFVKQKLERQRKNINGSVIASYYKDIIEIDYKIKSGLLESGQAKFLLINRFLKN